MTKRAQIRKHLPALAALAAAHGLIYREYWLLQKLFSGSDFFSLFAPAVNFQSDCMREGSWPFWNPYINFGFPWIDNYINSSLFPTHLLGGLLTRFSIETLQLEVLCWIFISGLGVYLLVYDYASSRRSALITGISFMFCGPLLALPQWSSMVYNAAAFPFLLLGYHRAKRAGNPVSLLSIGFLAVSILGGYTTASVVSIYFLIAYVIIDSLFSKRIVFGITFASCTITLALLLALPKLLPLYASMDASARMSFFSHPDKAYGIISPYSFMSMVLPVKFYYSLYAGALTVLVLLYAFIRRKLAVNPVFMVFLVIAWFLITDQEGSISLLRSAANAVLPFSKLIGLEFFFWDFSLVFLLLYISPHVESFLSDDNMRWKFMAMIVFLAVSGVVFISSFNLNIYLTAFIVQGALAFALTGASFLKKRRGLQTFVVVSLVMLDSLIVFARVQIDIPPQRSEHVLRLSLTHQNFTSQSYRDAERVNQRWDVVISRDEFRPSVDGSRQRPFLKVNVSGGDAEALNQKIFAGIGYNPQRRKEFDALVNSPGFFSLQGQPLFFFIDAATGLRQVDTLTFDLVSCAAFEFTSRNSSPGYLVLRQMYDKRWRAFVDEQPQTIQKAEGFFMAVAIPPGIHTIRFAFQDNNFIIALIISAVILIGLLWLSYKRVKEG